MHLKLSSSSSPCRPFAESHLYYAWLKRFSLSCPFSCLMHFHAQGVFKVPYSAGWLLPIFSGTMLSIQILSKPLCHFIWSQYFSFSDMALLMHQFSSMVRFCAMPVFFHHLDPHTIKFSVTIKLKKIPIIFFSNCKMVHDSHLYGASGKVNVLKIFLVFRRISQNVYFDLCVGVVP